VLGLLFLLSSVWARKHLEQYRMVWLWFLSQHNQQRTFYTKHVTDGGREHTHLSR
jgi:hypothetical protein